MKKLLFFCLLAIISFAPLSSKAAWFLLYVKWETEGRESKGCSGWGLCGLDVCAFCDRPEARVAPITFNDVSGEGTLVVALDPDDPVHTEAIAEQSTFYIDEDIIIDNGTFTITVQAGEYPFDSGIETSGGYTIPVTAVQN